MRYAGLGFELAAAIVGLTLMGLWIDYRFRTKPWGTVIGAMLGVVGGLYNFIRAALQMSRTLPKSDFKPTEKDQDDAG